MVPPKFHLAHLLFYLYWGILWNLTKIAASRDPRALELFRTLMVASAAIPGAFPPTMIDVEVNGQPYQEMHVGGGATAQVFVYPPSLDLRDKTRQLGLQQRERRVYVIRNSRLDPEWAQVERSTMTIAERAISSLIHTQGIGDLYRIYLPPNATASISTWRISRTVSTHRTRKILTPSSCANSSPWGTTWGRITLTGSGSALLHDPKVRAAYLGEEA